jgi:Flp pilus assembly protein TadD
MEESARRSKVFKPASQLRLALFVCAGLLFSPTVSRASPQQDNAPPGSSAAELAYHEVEAKDYSSAIRDFRAALDANSSNLLWRKDLAYACLAAGDKAEAEAEFEQIYAQHPEDSGVALQLGYIFQELGRADEARKYYQVASSSADVSVADPARKALADLREAALLSRKRQGYDLLAQKRTGEAIEAFKKVHVEDPSDGTVTLQLAYLFAALGRQNQARALFKEASASRDLTIAEQARAGLRQERREVKPWFASVYLAPFYQSRFSNEINVANAKVGFNPNRYFQPYLGVRFSRDIRSRTGTLPEIYSDNTSVFSLGVQSVLANSGAAIYAEAGTALNLIGGRPLAAPDYRAGMYWSKSWGNIVGSSASTARSIGWTGSAYADGGFYNRYQHDAIGSAQLREGIRQPGSKEAPMQLLGAINLVKDSNGYFYNNVLEAGPVLRLTITRSVPILSLEAQYVRGFYTTHDPANPNGPRYGDFRVLLIWSQNF